MRVTTSLPPTFKGWHTGGMKSLQRGLTIVEVLIVLSIVGVIAVLLIRSQAFDANDAAHEWARSLKYTLISSECTNSPGTTGYIRCTVRVEENREPISLECGVVSERCSMRLVR